jgi:hypothetical protein
MSPHDESTSPAEADDWRDPVIEAYKKDVDRTLLRENLKLTVEERIRQFESFMRDVYAIRGAAGKRPSNDSA